MTKKFGKCLYAIILYLTTPYFLYLLTERKDAKAIIAFLMAPLAFLLEYKYKEIRDANRGFHICMCVGLLLITAAVTAMSPIWGMMLVLSSVIVLLIQKGWLAVLGVIVGCSIGNINQMPFWRFVLLGELNNASVDLVKIGTRGYSLGNYFMNWTFFEGRPGIGFGYGISIAVLVWNLIFVRINKTDRVVKWFAILAILFAILSYKLPLWDITERISPVFLRLISEVETPTLMFGLANSLFLIPAVYHTNAFCEDKQDGLYKWLPYCASALAIFAFWKFIFCL